MPSRVFFIYENRYKFLFTRLSYSAKAARSDGTENLLSLNRIVRCLFGNLNVMWMTFK